MSVGLDTLGKMKQEIGGNQKVSYKQKKQRQQDPLHPALTLNYSFLKNGLNRSIGIGKRIVELLSAETSFRV